MLWAGADPYAPGVYRCDEEPEPDTPGITALELAALSGHFGIFASKRVQLDGKHPAMRGIARWVCAGKGGELLKRLLDRKFVINDRENGGSSTIQYLLLGLECGIWNRDIIFGTTGHDSKEFRDRMEALRLLVERGGRWAPEDKAEINDIRRVLLKLRAEYTAELVLIMTRHRACDKKHLEDLLRTPSIKTHVKEHQLRIARLLASWK